MTPSDTLLLQALKLKELNSRNTTVEMSEKIIESAIAQNPDQKDLRNICAMISVPMFNDVEELCNLLDLSKRVFVEMALSDFITKARGIVLEVDPMGEREGAWYGHAHSQWHSSERVCNPGQY